MLKTDPLHPIHIWKKHLPFKLIQFKCFACQQPGWIPEFVPAFECKHCGQGLVRAPEGNEK